MSHRDYGQDGPAAIAGLLAEIERLTCELRTGKAVSKAPATLLRGDSLWLWCPGCEDLHNVIVSGTSPVLWDWDGNPERPTISPSILVQEVRKADDTVYMPRCHSFVSDGVWDFLADSGHALAGRRMPMTDVEPEWPEWLRADGAEGNE